MVFPGNTRICGDCMVEIRRLGLHALVREVSLDRPPVLGYLRRHGGIAGAQREENDGVDCIGLSRPGGFSRQGPHEAYSTQPHMAVRSW